MSGTARGGGRETREQADKRFFGVDIEDLIRAALVYGVNQVLDYLKELLQGQLQRSLGNGGPGKEKSPGYVRAITR